MSELCSIGDYCMGHWYAMKQNKLINQRRR